MKKIKKPSKKRIQFSKDILDIIGPIIANDDFKRLKTIRHHVFFNRYEHLMNVAKMAYKMAQFFGADVETCALAGLLHDYHFTRIKSYGHAVIAAKNAQELGVPREVIDIVQSHMYPLGGGKIPRAKGKNFWIVKVADFIAPLLEITYSVLALQFKYEDIIKFKTNQFLLDMLLEESYVLSDRQA